MDFSLEAAWKQQTEQKAAGRRTQTLQSRLLTQVAADRARSQ
jgi:hypothetical protein